MLDFKGVSSKSLWELLLDAQESCFGRGTSDPIVHIKAVVDEGFGVAGDLLVTADDVQLLAQDVAARFVTERAYNKHELGEAGFIQWIKKPEESSATIGEPFSFTASVSCR